MAIRTRTPSRGWSSVAPYSNYQYVVSNYAASLAAATTEEENNELESKILSYKDGSLSYQDLVNYVNTRLTEETPGTSKELVLRETLMNIEDYERAQNVSITRARMHEQYAKGGVSASEQLQIEQALLPYYKEGSADYATQLAVISTAKEIERVESNNEKVSRLQAELSTGGLETSEQIDILKAMKKYAEPGSMDAMEIEAKIGTMEETKKQEDKAVAMNERLSQLMDEYTPGGISDAEALTINREMQTFVDKGSDDYIKLKQQEASLLESSGTAGGSKQAQSIFNEISVQQAQLKELTDAYSSGGMTTGEYLRQKEALMSLITPSDVPAGAEEYGSAQELFDLSGFKKEAANFQQMKQKIESGQAVIVPEGTGGRKLVTLEELSTPQYSITGQVLDENGELVEQNLAQIYDDDGNLKTVTIDEGGTLWEVVAPTNEGDPFTKTGDIIDPSALMQGIQSATNKYTPSAGFATDPFNPSASLGATTTTATPGGMSASLGATTTAATPGGMSSPSAAVRASLLDSAKSSSSGFSAFNKGVSPVLPTITPTAGKVAGTKDYGVTETIESLTGAKSSPGKINVSAPGVGTVNLPEYGVTEAAESLFSTAKSTASNWWNKLFGK